MDQSPIMRTMPGTSNTTPSPNNDSNAEKPLNKFRVSSALKNLIGKELITDDYIAVFELIKNSYDALAKKVTVVFEKDKIIIKDDGTGMDREDVRNKWLFVGYSAKVDETVSIDASKDYRKDLSLNRQIAGAKGVGRFSCDRLGQNLVLETKVASSKASGICLDIDWGKFEVDPKQEFVDIQVKYDEKKSLENVSSNGTALVITKLRSSWDRDKILGLRHHLQRLIHPNEASSADFSIIIKAEGEKAKDRDALDKLEKKYKGEQIPPEILQREIVNGNVKNLLFEKLGIKTTQIEVVISGETIETTLSDRGNLIYKIRQKNELSNLNGISCNLFYLNRSAKWNFHRIMGIRNVWFGSIFVFRNGFRVYPIGEPEDDSFKIDQRHAQQFRERLSTRDILGHLDIQDAAGIFKESTSRDGGLIKSEATSQLEEFFLQYCLVPLENYVVGALWKIKDDKDADDIKLLLTDPSRARIIDIVSKMVKAEDVEIIDYNRDLIKIVQNKLDGYLDTLERLKQVAESSKDKGLIEQIKLAEERFAELRRAEEEARRELEQERAAREEAEKKARSAEEEKRDLEEELKQEREVSLFLKSVQPLDTDIVVNLHHQIGICSSTIEKSLKGASLKLAKGVQDPKGFLEALIEQISFENRKIIAITKFATRANFRLESETMKEDLASYCAQYLENVQPLYEGSGLTIEVHRSSGPFVTRFKPIEMVILLDNLISNSRKAEASTVNVSLDQTGKTSLVLTYTDNGKGLSRSLKEKERIFDKGFTTTYGSGLGMYHVAQILDTMGADYSIKSEIGKRGFAMEAVFRQ